jgi:ABC-type multidrug transport system ATPase subunit
MLKPKSDNTIKKQSISIRLTDLSKRFNREWIFKNINYQFNSGQFYAITGPNGSGKSTLMQVLSGLVPPSSGKIMYSMGEGVIPSEEIYKHITYAAPYMDLIEEFTLEEHLRFHFSLRKMKEGLDLNGLINILHLEKARKKHIGNFSSGMKQRVKLALAFYTQSDIIILDEPGTNLDEPTFNWYFQMLTRESGNSLVLIASNNPAEYPAETIKLNIQEFKSQHYSTNN